MAKIPKRFCEYRRCRGFRKLPGRFETKINGIWRASCVCCTAKIDRSFPDASKRNVLLPAEMMYHCFKCGGYHTHKERCTGRPMKYTDVLEGRTVRELFSEFYNIAWNLFPSQGYYVDIQKGEDDDFRIL